MSVTLCTASKSTGHPRRVQRGIVSHGPAGIKDATTTKTTALEATT